MLVIEADLGEVALGVWRTVLGFNLVPSPRGGVGEERGELMIGSLSFTGAWTGVLSLFCPVSLARDAAAVIFETEALSTTTEQTAQVIGELTNITSGNLKPFFPRPVYMGLPIVARGGNLTQVLPGAGPISQVYLDCRGSQVGVRLAQARG